MKLLTQEIIKKLPALYSQEKVADPIVQFKLFTPSSSWTWFVTEGEKQEDGDWLLFAFTIGHEKEWGYVSLNELKAVRGPFGLGIERDLYFSAAPFSEVMARYNRERGIKTDAAPATGGEIGA